MSELSGSPQVNPRPHPRAISDRAKFHKKYSVEKISTILNKVN